MADATETLTENEAVARLEDHLQLAAGQLDPCPRLEPGLSGTMPCDDPTDGGPMGRVFVEAHYMLRGVDPADNRRVFDTLYRFWTEHGYALLQDLRDREKAPQLKVRHADDGFSISLRQNLADELKLSGSSPCVWPGGNPPPADGERDE
jgi:hypothetical protein